MEQLQVILYLMCMGTHCYQSLNLLLGYYKQKRFVGKSKKM